MKNISRIVTILVVILILSAAYNYYRIMIKKDYLILIPIACDPQTEDCFEDQCLKDTPDECYNTELYYKLLSKRAYNVPACYSLPPDERTDCPPLECRAGEKDCFIDFCDEKDEAEGMVCK